MVPVAVSVVLGQCLPSYVSCTEGSVPEMCSAWPVTRGSVQAVSRQHTDLDTVSLLRHIS